MSPEERNDLARKLFGQEASFTVKIGRSGAYRACVRYRPDWHSAEVIAPSTFFEADTEQEAIDASELSLIELERRTVVEEAWSGVIVAAEDRDFDALEKAVERLRAVR